MELTDPATIRTILKEYGMSAQKKLGQHFLIDQAVLSDTIRAAQLTAKDTVLEIGPGLGTLTRALCDQALQVVAIEKDPQMIKAFRLINADLTNVQLLAGNALVLPPKFFTDTLKGNYKLVANLPYYLTSAILRFFLQTKWRPAMMVLMVQREVAERIIATPPDANLLSVAVQFYGQPKLIQTIPARSFWPAPKVDSAIIKIIPHPKALYSINDERKFFRIVKAGFSQRRKQLHNSLSGGLNLSDETVRQALRKSRIASHRRAQTLTLAEWVKLYEKIKIT
ncbi:ribosomal RNA small subunit methyltransferase A [candidate division Kazan bacterium RBG_13_50_9]|uniref:Ribosomal RNA small subunit methyltransferase A n=1 Tax=candidate division Kazan bacterium RBG_13_50_9 TaxID=1798535 RepID=A0A1F4NSI5_UNCK3|nr:MAG: ribosomal RNA small subunit methyltransferase A [candidate division Kazan bacterium RBG_13_50_9]